MFLLFFFGIVFLVCVGRLFVIIDVGLFIIFCDMVLVCEMFFDVKFVYFEVLFFIIYVIVYVMEFWLLFLVRVLFLMRWFGWKEVKGLISMF